MVTTLVPVSTKYQLSTQFIEVCQPSNWKVLFNARPEEALKVNHIGLRKNMDSSFLKRKASTYHLLVAVLLV